MPKAILMETLSRKLLGYYRYYGITDNRDMVKDFCEWWREEPDAGKLHVRWCYPEVGISGEQSHEEAARDGVPKRAPEAGAEIVDDQQKGGQSSLPDGKLEQVREKCRRDKITNDLDIFPVAI